MRSGRCILEGARTDVLRGIRDWDRDSKNGIFHLESQIGRLMGIWEQSSALGVGFGWGLIWAADMAFVRVQRSVKRLVSMSSNESQASTKKKLGRLFFFQYLPFPSLKRYCSQVHSKLFQFRPLWY